MALGLVLGLAGSLSGSVAVGATNQTTTYKWVDEQGVVHYGDSVPPQYAEKEHKLLNGQGVEIGHTEAQKTPEQLAVDAQEHDAIVKQQQHDTFLLATYTSVKDIESLRDVRLDQLQGQRTAAEQYVENLHSRLVALQGRVKHFRPYNTRPDARRMPDDLAEDLVHTLNEMHTQNNALVAKNQEVAAMKDQFDLDINRYRELHGAHSKR
jgi:predicted  nucleic acid-binding Zn-ribbon protein